MADSNHGLRPGGSAAAPKPPATAPHPAPPAPPAAAAAPPVGLPGAATPSPNPRAASAGNPALRMLGLPNLPRKLPSRNWLIFWAVTGTVASAIVYDRREKRRATARWRRAVEPLSRELVAAPNQLPRKLTVYLEAPPGDGLRVAQDHFIEYVKPVLAASGLDWEFVQGRQQGDVRAAIAEKVRRTRMAQERPGQEPPKTDDALVEELRKKMGVPQYEGVKGDVVIGRHTWKEYVRGLHEGWLGPLDPPPRPPPPPQAEAVVEAETPKTDASTADAAAERGEGDEKEVKKDEKPSRPPQPPPHNTIADYASASLPAHIPAEFSPSAPIPFPHRLGFTQTFVRLGRFFNRRGLADEVGRDVAAVCLAAGREWRKADDGQYEQQLALAHEEADCPRRPWQDGADDDAADDAATEQSPKEKIWTAPMVLDERIVQRMRRFELTPEDGARAAAVVVPEEELEGWVKGSLRGLWRWGAKAFEGKPRGPNVGNLDDD